MSILHGTAARTKLLRGAVALSRAVAVTYGPGGRTALIQRFSGHLSTKDGLTVAQEMSLSDPVENLGCQLMKQACLKVNKDCGDGTTSTAIIAGALLREGHKRIVAGQHPREVVKEIEDAARVACSLVRGCSRSVNTQAELNRVAFTACNGDAEIAEHLAEACMAVGKDGTVSIVDGIRTDTVLELKDGMEFDRGAASHAFLNGEVERVLEGALVAVVPALLHSVESVVSMLEEATQWPQNPLLIFSTSVAGAALQTLLLNSAPANAPTKGVGNCAVEAPGMPHQKLDNLKDIAALTRATVVDPAAGMDITHWKPEWFGTVRRATISKTKTLLEAYPETRDSIEVRMGELRGEIARTLPGFEQDQLQERLGRLSGGVALLRVGGVTEAARKERRARIEDALGAVQCALRGGVVPGGASTYSWVAGQLDPGPMQTALQKPLQTLLRNAGVQVPLQEAPQGFGWDSDQKMFRDLLQDPLIVDPTDVVESAIKAAVSVVGTLLLVETSVTKA